MLSDEGLRNATANMSGAAEQISRSASSLWDTLDRDRQLREEQLQRFERAVELQALAILLQAEVSEKDESPKFGAINTLENLLKERGVL